MKSFSVTTLGCKVNRYESEALSEQLQDHGWRPIGPGTSADLCIINTCTVTQKAAMQSRQAVRKAVRGHPRARVVAMGCYAQVAPEVFTSMPGVHYVAGNTFKNRIVRLASHHNPCGPAESLVGDISACRLFQDLPVTRFGSRTRPFLKIQDGCDAFCSYCIIPHARGPSRSLKPQVVVERIRRFKESGYFEVVLCGINIGRYGQDLKPTTSLGSLIRSVDGPEGVKRLRLSSIEPAELSAGLIEHLATSRHVCPHLHIPLQSGDNDVLKRMGRPYNSLSYADLIHHTVRVIPDVAVGVDVLVGFPGETPRAFENTCRLVEELPVAYLHVFPFSKQKGTPAATLPGPVPPETIKKRCRHLRGIGQHKWRKFLEKFMGATLEVLIEGKPDKATGYRKGLTRNYIPVLTQGSEELLDQVLPVRLTRIEHGKVFGQAVSSQ
jgi:threonylcarbamoyladenosine tRNA methylthiotransferase MtaB